MIHIYNPSSTGAELILDTVSNAVASGIRFQVGGTFLGNISYSPASDGIIIEVVMINQIAFCSTKHRVCWYWNGNSSIPTTCLQSFSYWSGTYS